jgi:hypothetical protein
VGLEIPRRWEGFRRWCGDDPWVARFVALYLLLQLVLATWDLPNSWSWEVDAVAPRELFAGLVDNLSPGARHRYPLLQYVLIALVSLPVLLYGYLTADGSSLRALEASMIRPEVMTGVSLASKALTVAMGGVALLTLARIGRRLFSVGVGRWAVAFAVTNVSVAYYGRTNNLDMPYLMWTTLALDRLLSISEHGRWRDYAGFAFCAGASVATKDQAYASILLPAVFVLLLAPIFAGRPPDVRRLLPAVGLGALTLAALGGALWNPLGFVRRVRVMLGPASANFRGYERSLEGLGANLFDLVVRQAEHWWPWPAVGVAWVGLAMVAVRTRQGGPLRLLPALMALSSLIFFTLAVGRSTHRFVLPLGWWLALYAGVAAHVVTSRWGKVGRGLAASLVVLAAAGPLELALTQWNDARLEAERFLARLPEGTSVETWGRVVYQPRYAAAPYRAVHVHSTKGPRERPPMPGVEAIEAPYEGLPERDPDVLVLPSSFIEKRLGPQRIDGGRTMAKHIAGYRENRAVVDIVQAAVDDRLPGYQLALLARARLPTWSRWLGLRPRKMHGSTGRPVWIWVRASGSPAPRSSPGL